MSPQSHDRAEARAEATPGPWTIDEDANVVCGRDDIIAWVSSPDSYVAGDVASMANARLIAAAPTMAEYISKRAAAGDDEARKIMESINADS